jgi:hypothetical protein
MVITISVLPPFTYPSLSLCSHGVITVLCDLQIFLCPTIGNVTCVPCAVTLKIETSGVLMTLGAICHHLEASSTEVTFSATRYAESFVSDPPRPDPDRTEAPPCSRLSLQKMRRYVTNIVMKRRFATEGGALVQGISVTFDLHPQ